MVDVIEKTEPRASSGLETNALFPVLATRRLMTILMFGSFEGSRGIQTKSSCSFF